MEDRDDHKVTSIDEALDKQKPSDLVIIGCRAKNPLPWEVDVAKSIGLDINEHYADSVESICAACGRAVMMGPRQLELAARSSAQQITLCLICVVQLQRLSEEMTTEIYSLGNPQFDEEQ